VRARAGLLVALLAGLAACARAHADPSVGEEAGLAPEGASPEVDGGAGSVSTTTTRAGTPSEAMDAGADGVTLYAFGVQAPILSAPEWPPKDATKAEESRHGVVRLGYLRRGERVLAKRGVLSKANCAEGWYELATGGFVCGKFATTDAHHKELRFAPHAPYLDRNLPYEYGLNLTPGTPLYRRLPTKAERRDNEKTLALGKGKKASDIAKKLKESGEAVPAYLAENGTAKPTVSFEDLKGDSELLAQRMLKGFYLSLDRKVDGRSGVFWHTVSGMMAPKDHLIVHDPKTEFEGVVLDASSSIRGEGDATREPRKLPLAFVVSTKAIQVTVDVAAKDATAGDKIERFSILELTGKRQAIGERVYHETRKGFWVRDIDVAVVALPSVAEGIAKGERWIDVDLGSQALVAFEGDRPVYATVVSTGRRSADPDKDHRTAMGSFRIREKHVTTTMDDDGASDGTYRIEDVPWVMYFEKSLALHGAFWHSSFGRERSHGCVNLTPYDARHLFGWAGPVLPEGWHGVRATKDNPGTRVVVHK
jgi:lipoprotein-anchoring transpeptidase ErfK/SrfK